MINTLNAASPDGCYESICCPICNRATPFGAQHSTAEASADSLPVNGEKLCWLEMNQEDLARDGIVNTDVHPSKDYLNAEGV